MQLAVAASSAWSCLLVQVGQVGAYTGDPARSVWTPLGEVAAVEQQELVGGF
jgi:hypothetical protein